MANFVACQDPIFHVKYYSENLKANHEKKTIFRKEGFEKAQNIRDGTGLRG